MCGIVGVLQYESELPQELRLRAIKLLFTYTMLQTEVRGEDATGLYQVHKDGDWGMAKKGIKVSDWLFEGTGKPEDSVTYNDFTDSWGYHPQDFTALVGHCRKATVGSRGRDNRDDHPFSVQVDERNAILGVHNGTLLNHETIFKKLPDTLERQGTVDSESIFHLLYHLSDKGTKPFDGPMLQEVGKRLDGAYACVAVNSRFPNIVATFRETRPLEYFVLTPLNIIVIASEKKFVEAAIANYDFIRKMMDTELPELTHYDRTLLDKDYRIFDTYKEFPTGKVTFADFDKISIQGVLRTHTETLIPGWAHVNPAAKSTTGTATHTGGHVGKTSAANPGSAGTTLHPKVSKPDTRTLLEKQRALQKGIDDTGVTIEVEVGSQEEAEKALIAAKSLGLCPTFYSSNEIGISVGKSAADFGKLNPVETAKLVVQHRLTRGHGADRFYSQGGAEDIRQRGK